MTKSRTLQNAIIRLIIVAAAVNGMLADRSHARPRPVVKVTIEPEYHVCRPNKKEHIFQRLKLTYQIPEKSGDQRATIFIPDAVQGGAGLVVEHVSPDGTVTNQSLPPKPWWFSHGETVRMESTRPPIYLNMWVLPGMHLDFSELGIYHISYVHPLPETEEDPNTPVFVSNILTIACVTGERCERLYEMLHERPELAFASYMFKNPPAAVEWPQYWRGVGAIDEAITPGVRQDEVLLLLGSPDMIQHTAPSEQEYCDEKWSYETSPVGGYHVNFKNGCVVSKGHHADCAGD